MGHWGIGREILEFMRLRKRYWLTPVILVLLVIGLIIVFAAGSAFAPFIYTLF
jgi:hypothetical protein